MARPSADVAGTCDDVVVTDSALSQLPRWAYLIAPTSAPHTWRWPLRSATGAFSRALVRSAVDEMASNSLFDTLGSTSLIRLFEAHRIAWPGTPCPGALLDAKRRNRGADEEANPEWLESANTLKQTTAALLSVNEEHAAAVREADVRLEAERKKKQKYQRRLNKSIMNDTQKLSAIFGSKRKTADGGLCKRFRKVVGAPRASVAQELARRGREIQSRKRMREAEALKALTQQNGYDLAAEEAARMAKIVEKKKPQEKEDEDYVPSEDGEDEEIVDDGEAEGGESEEDVLTFGAADEVPEEPTKPEAADEVPEKPPQPEAADDTPEKSPQPEAVEPTQQPTQLVTAVEPIDASAIISPDNTAAADDYAKPSEAMRAMFEKELAEQRRRVYDTTTHRADEEEADEESDDDRALDRFGGGDEDAAVLRQAKRRVERREELDALRYTEDDLKYVVDAPSKAEGNADAADLVFQQNVDEDLRLLENTTKDVTFGMRRTENMGAHESARRLRQALEEFEAMRELDEEALMAAREQRVMMEAEQMREEMERDGGVSEEAKAEAEREVREQREFHQEMKKHAAMRRANARDSDDEDDHPLLRAPSLTSSQSWGSQPKIHSSQGAAAAALPTTLKRTRRMFFQQQQQQQQPLVFKNPNSIVDKSRHVKRVTGRLNSIVDHGRTAECSTTISSRSFVFDNGSRSKKRSVENHSSSSSSQKRVAKRSKKSSSSLSSTDLRLLGRI